MDPRVKPEDDRVNGRHILRMRICACIVTIKNSRLVESAGSNGEYKLWQLKGATNEADPIIVTLMGNQTVTAAYAQCYCTYTANINNLEVVGDYKGSRLALRLAGMTKVGY